MPVKVTLLGTGTSYGVPMIGCECEVCRSTDPRDRRLRTSALIDLPAADPSNDGRHSSAVATAVRRVLIDTSSDLRAQALTHDIRRLDAIPDSSWPLLEGVHTLVLDALRDRPHTTHFSVAEAVKAAERIGAVRTYFTHISHELGHQVTSARLPRGVELAYDGLVLEIEN
jgi:phosphoribosyl 1,2-cyclic phosphodiesterase